MKGSISFGYESETPEAKARWFKSLTMDERIDYFCEMTDLALSLNPDLKSKSNDQPPGAGVRVLSLP